ncbi:MAG TPA: cytochrome c peroxidase [Saprospiraceae bacterium]|nr:cytochrome c peroxidase [Saprospiraceae bacterium]HNG88937.1 cytochrome c peroxidase [Saprospiraceae bacterium]
MKKVKFYLPLAALALLAIACEKKSDFNYYYYSPEEYAILSERLKLNEIPDDYTVNFPQHLRAQGLFPRPVERDKAVLGRVLFYDKSLSKDGTIACGSCHKQGAAFGDTKAISPGIYERIGDRNAIALSSVSNFSAYYGTDLNGDLAIRFFWDNRAATAKEQSKGSLTNPKEMGMHMEEVADAVRNQPYYTPLFKKAYGDDNVTADRVLESIANFVNAMGSYQSRFDEEATKAIGNQYYLDNDKDFAGFSAAENAGKKIYQQNCAGCHSPIMGRPMLFNASNGLDAATTADRGVGPITSFSGDEGTFKVPTLRNIALSAPYMHDGRFKTLEEVVEHYNSGIKAHPNLHNLLKSNGQPKRLNLNQTDKQNLIAFLNTLTDDHLLKSERFSDPFKQ